MTARQVIRIREKLGLSREQLAERLGLSIRTVQGWEYGRKPNGSGATMMRVLEEKFDQEQKGRAA